MVSLPPCMCAKAVCAQALEPRKACSEVRWSDAKKQNNVSARSDLRPARLHVSHRQDGASNAVKFTTKRPTKRIANPEATIHTVCQTCSVVTGPTGSLPKLLNKTICPKTQRPPTANWSTLQKRGNNKK